MRFDRVAVDCKKAQKKDGKDLAWYCGMQNWNICYRSYVLWACPMMCKVCKGKFNSYSLSYYLNLQITWVNPILILFLSS